MVEECNSQHCPVLYNYIMAKLLLLLVYSVIVLQVSVTEGTQPDILNANEILNLSGLGGSGNAVSGKSYLYVGEQLQLYCTLPPDFVKLNYTTIDIRFRKSNPLKSSQYWICLEQQYISVNSSTATLTINNITEEESGSYFCIIGNCTENLDSEKFVGAFNDIKIQYKPHNVTDFECFVFNWNDYMHFSWQHPIPYVENLKDTYVSVWYNSDFTRPVFVECPLLTMTSCIISYSRMTVYTIIISVTNNKTQDTASETFHCIPPHSVKPAPVHNLEAIDLKENGCFRVNFNHNATHWNKSFNIYIQDSDNTEWKLYMENLTNTYLKVCDYKPYISVKISVKCCPAGIFQGICSNPTNISYITPQIAPLKGPESVNGSYSTKNCNNGKDRNVTVFWKDVNKSYLNGLLKEYEVKYRENIIKISKEAYQITIQMPCNSVQMVHIFAVNDAGKSIQPTTLAIAPYSFQVPAIVEQSLSVEVSSTKALLLWKEDSSQSLSKTVFWCESMNNKMCEGKISWHLIPKYETSETITDVIPQRTNFGLAVSDENGTLTSAIVWFECYYNPQAPLPQINIMKVLPDKLSAVVIWDVIKCSKSSLVKVTSYSIIYCVKRLCDDYANIKSEDVYQNVSTYKISNLIEGEIYKVAVVAKFGNITGPKSNWMQTQPVAPQNLSNEAVIPAVATVLTLLVLLACALFINKCGKSKSKMKAWILTQEEYVQNTSLESQRSSETSEEIYPEVSDLTETGQNFQCESSDSSGVFDDNSRCKLISKQKVEKQHLQCKRQVVEKVEIFPKDPSIVGQHLKTHAALENCHTSIDENKNMDISPYSKVQLSSSCELKTDSTLLTSNQSSEESGETMKSDSTEVIPETLRMNSCPEYVVSSNLRGNFIPKNVSSELPIDLGQNSIKLEILQNSHLEYMVVNEQGSLTCRQNMHDVLSESPAVLGQNIIHLQTFENVQLGNNLPQQTEQLNSVFSVPMSNLPGPELNRLHSSCQSLYNSSTNISDAEVEHTGFNVVPSLQNSHGLNCDTLTSPPSTLSSDVISNTETLNSLVIQPNENTSLRNDNVTSASSSQLVPEINSDNGLYAVQYDESEIETQASLNSSLDDLPYIIFSSCQSQSDLTNRFDYVPH